MTELVLGRITQLTEHRCPCVCHDARPGRWRTHLCEHCAPRYARAHPELRRAGHGIDHPATATPDTAQSTRQIKEHSQ